MPRPWHHRPHLDGLRAVAATGVLLFHADLPAAAGGFVGVDAFFVLSGFLITALLLREHDASGGIDLRRFWGRRARRLLPTALVVLAATVALWATLKPPLEAALHADDVLASALYASNWWFFASAHDYFAHDQAVSPVLHTWSLAVEEQFYIVWPLLVLGLVRVVPARARTVVLGVAATAGLGWALAQDPLRAHYATDARAGQLLLGATLATVRFPVVPAARWAALAAVAGLGVLGSGLLDIPPVPRGIGAALLTAGFVAAGEAAGPGVRVPGLSGPVSRLLGRVSYASYLWHWPVLLLLPDMAPELDALGRAAVGFAVVTALAWLTWRLVEQPLRGPGNGRAIAVGLAASVAVGFGGRAALQAGDADGLVMGDHFEEMEPQATLVAGPPAPPGAPRLLLAGDSHAEHWWPAVRVLAEARGWQADLLWVQDCGWPAMDLEQTGATAESRCQPKLRAALQAHVEQEEVDLVLLASFTTAIRVLPGEAQVPVPEEEARARIAAASAAVVDPLVAAGAQVAMLEPIPVLAKHPLSCVTADLDASACPTTGVEIPLDRRAEAAWQAVAAERSGVWAIDLDDVACPDRVCRTVADGRLTRRDTHHLMSGFAASLAEPLDAALRRQGVDLQSQSTSGER